MNSQKTAVITGASSGIGYALSIEMAKRGYQVYACARRLEPMEELKKYGVKTFRCDVSDLQSVLEARAYIEEETNGALDILYNNAGQVLMSDYISKQFTNNHNACNVSAIDATDEQAMQCYQVNVFGPIRMTREFSRLLIKAKGTVVFTGSIAALTPFPWTSIYGSTKAAIHQFAAVLHLEMKPFGVRVINVVTGGVKTNIEDNRPFPATSVYNCPELEAALVVTRRMVNDNRPMPAVVYAKKVVNHIESGSNKLNIHRGSMSTILPFLMRWVPRWVVERIIAGMFKLIPLWKALHKKAAEKAEVDLRLT